MKGFQDRGLLRRFKGFQEEELAGSLICNGQRVTIPAVAELELALEIGAPEVIGSSPLRQQRAVRTMARPAGALDEPMAVQHSMDGAAGGNPDIAGQAADQQLADLARAPMWLLALEADDQAFDWGGS